MRKITIEKEIVEKIINQYKDGIGSSKISKMFGYTKRKIVNVLRENNIKIIGTKRYNVNDNFFEVINNEENAYWLGFLFADGYVRFRNGKYGEVNLKLQFKDHNHVELFKKTINSNNPIKDSINNKGHKETSLSLYSTKMATDLTKLGCVENKTKLIRVPTIPNELMRHFIRGYFDGDGCISQGSKTGTMEFYVSSGSIEFLNDLSSIFNDIRITKQDFRENNSKTIMLKICRVNDMKKLYHYFYDDSKFYLGRKKEIFKEVLKKEGRK